ncbi:tRNA pseudouridine(55) synthase TruB [Ahrensia sp. 13_GOM-1096m]|uniref:tRNA pseudouridine(55) synthase TruB n=1 Tax=Ahrensia sp. 13_GOM-1096m TaxID=1380380 RepID=UPI00047E8201|nr:tRNA pseudouridine(55) synthase TruB [Ahrensia sp. 13_GOM-1096m]
MARQRKKKGRPVSGWIILDKPLEMGSTEAVGKIKWLFGAQKAGHGGTLDPLATGVLPIALGEATKTMPYVTDGTKAYRFKVAWGAQTSTDDLEGEQIKTSDKRPERAEVEAILANYTGVISQIPPQFSAIKIDGARAYDLARGGEQVDIKAREVEIDEIKITEHAADETTFEVECGKGTYVRSLARDLGIELGCYGHVTELRRTLVEPFDEADLVSLSDLEAAKPEIVDDEAVDYGALDALLLDTGEAMGGLPRVELSDEQAQRIRMGNPALLIGRDAPIAEDEACAFIKGKLLAIGEIGKGTFQPKRVFNL